MPDDLNTIRTAAQHSAAGHLAKLQRTHGQLHDAVPADQYAQAWLGDWAGRYTTVRPHLAELAARVVTTSKAAASLYNRYLIASHLGRFELEASELRLPPIVVPLYRRELARILRQLEQTGDELFDLRQDAFLKDLGIVTHRLIPVGAGFCEPGSGIPRRALLPGGVGQLLRGAAFITLRCRGFRPFLGFHAHVLSLSDFDPAGWNRTYHAIAELLEANPDYKGWTGTAWYLDPAMRWISPHLCYLRDVPERNGCMFLRVGVDRQGTSGALAKSSRRRALYDEGRYQPELHMRVWPRSAMLRWHRKSCTPGRRGGES